MKAVNLIPADAPRGERVALGFAASGSGIGAYVVIAVLALVVLMAGAAALTNKQLSDKRTQVATVERDAAAAEAKAAALKPYTEFAALRRARVETIGGLLSGRFDWAHSMREVARVVPGDVALVSMVGSVSPTATVGGGGGGGSLRSALAAPAIDLVGCAKSQAHVARLLARLRSIDGTQRVTLGSSEKSESAGLSDSDCRANDRMPQFQITVFYNALDGIVPATDAVAQPPAGGTAPAASTTASAGGAK